MEAKVIQLQQPTHVVPIPTTIKERKSCAHGKEYSTNFLGQVVCTSCLQLVVLMEER